MFSTQFINISFNLADDLDISTTLATNSSRLLKMTQQFHLWYELYLQAVSVLETGLVDFVFCFSLCYFGFAFW